MSSVPTYEELLWPTLKAIEAKGGSASIQELSEQIASDMKLSDEILDVPHQDGPQSKFEYNSAWARTYLKKYAEAVDNTSRGIWRITEKAQSIQSENELLELVRRNKRSERSNVHRKQDSAHPDETNEVDNIELEWKESLLRIIQNIKPDAFERLCQRILRESGFIKVEVTGRSGDHGIDGIGVLRINLLSFHVRFQCKRYKNSVGVSDIRDFRGAMIGRADKGLFITTGRFTKEARLEAVRDGAPAIDLIDGDDVCNLLKDLGIGVTVESKTVEDITLETAYFENI